MSKGFLVVLEGIDGSGKTTQVELTVQKLKELGIDCVSIKFPRYEDNIYGALIKRYLEGELGKISDISPYLVALAYAGDRSLAKDLINKWLDEGKVIVCDRYISASKAHMAANLEESQKEEFIKWVDELEYQTNNLPKENLTIFLSVDPSAALQNIDQEIKDIHEQNVDHLRKAYQMYQKLSRTEPNWEVVECTENGKMRLTEDINNQIIQVVKSKLPS